MRLSPSLSRSNQNMDSIATMKSMQYSFMSPNPAVRGQGATAVDYPPMGPATNPGTLYDGPRLNMRHLRHNTIDARNTGQ